MVLLLTTTQKIVEQLRPREDAVLPDKSPGATSDNRLTLGPPP
jgi:hypothetical protein